MKFFHLFRMTLGPHNFIEWRLRRICWCSWGCSGLCLLCLRLGSIGDSLIRSLFDFWLLIINVVWQWCIVCFKFYFMLFLDQWCLILVYLIQLIIFFKYLFFLFVFRIIKVLDAFYICVELLSILLLLKFLFRFVDRLRHDYICFTVYEWFLSRIFIFLHVHAVGFSAVPVVDFLGFFL